MIFLANNLFNIIGLGLILYMSYGLYSSYIKRGNKMSDEQLIEAYIELERIKK